MSHYFEKGFTLVELIVTISIGIAILTTVMLNQTYYTDGAALKNLADEIATSISQAQIYGLGVKELTSGSGDFTASYGVEFNITNTGANNEYIFFADRGAKNGYYESGWSCSTGGASECLEKALVKNNDIITTLCEIPSSGPENCGIGRVAITFTRPDPEARITYFDLAGVLTSFASPKGVRIKVQSPRGATQSIIVYTTGQVSVQ
jgi:type II secretory pathway pseudopilin PulG